MSTISANEAAQQNNFNPTWMRSTFNASLGGMRPPSMGGGMNGTGGGDCEEDPPMSAPIFVQHRYGREELVALVEGVRSSGHPQGLDRCALFLPQPQPPIVLTPYNELEQRLQANVNSSKAMSQLTAVERAQVTNGVPDSPGGGGGPAAPTRTPNSNGGWQQVPAKPWTRGSSTPTRGGMTRGSAFSSGGRGGMVERPSGGGGAFGGGQPVEPGEASRFSGGGGAFGTSRRGQPPSGRGGSTAGAVESRGGGAAAAGGGGGGASSAFNSRAQGLYDPKNPNDRPRQRLRSTSEDHEVGGSGGQGTNGWQQPIRQNAWTRTTESSGGGPAGSVTSERMSAGTERIGGGAPHSRLPEWMRDDDERVDDRRAPPAERREPSSEPSSVSFDDSHGQFGQQQQPQTTRQMPQPTNSSPPISVTRNEDRLPSVPSTQSVWGASHAVANSSVTSLSSQPVEISQSTSSHYATPPQEMAYSPQSLFTYQMQAQAAAAAAAAAAPPPPPPKPRSFFYLDPQGSERGPFSLEQMEAWYKMGYFLPTLEVKREGDRTYTPLGNLVKMNGTSTPFRFAEPAPPPPPVVPVPPVNPYMDHLGLGGGIWDQQSAFSAMRAMPAVGDAMLIQQRAADEQKRRMEQHDEQMRMLRQMMARQESEHEMRERELREKSLEIQRQAEEMEKRAREMDQKKREEETRLQMERMEIEKKRRDIELRQRQEEEEEERRREEERKQKEKEEMRARRAREEEQERQKAEAEAAAERERMRMMAEETKRQQEKREREEQQRREAENAAAAQAKAKAEADARAQQERAAEVAAALAAAHAAAAVKVAAAASSPVKQKPQQPAKSAGPAWGATSAAPVKKQESKATLLEVMEEQQRQAKAEQRENEKLRKEQDAALAAAGWGKAKGPWTGSAPASAIVVSSSPATAAWGGAGLPSATPIHSSNAWDGPSLQQAHKSQQAAKSAPKSAAPAQRNDKSLEQKKQKEAENLKKAMSLQMTPEEAFTSWLVGRVKQQSTDVDADVLASFIIGVESPDEVEDFLVGYLGEGKGVKELVRECVQRKSDLRQARKATKGDDLSRAGAAVSTSAATSGGAKNIPKKKKGAKFVVDGACLGFRPTGNPNRVNQGEIERVADVPAGRR